jgi:ABC-type oligopeptide transport system ATPase subunit
VDGVSFELAEGETLGVVGESGCGKTTLGRALLRLIEPTSGEIRVDGVDFRALQGKALRAMRRNLQIVFQDPYSSLNPRMRVRQIIEEPLIIHKMGNADERMARVKELYGLVGLDPGTIDRYPHEFSGGQRQRIGVARALALNPSFIIADEPVSALDVSIQAQVVNLLIELQQKLGLAYLFIAHDLRLVEHICRRTAVMYLGRIVEMGDTARLFNNPQHAYTKALLSAIPVPDPDHRPARVTLNPKDVNFEAGLKEVEPGHFAAI